jgi:sugar phosphate isomerase/epimerase
LPYLSLTTWSLHRNLGPLRWTRWDEENGNQVTSFQEQPQTVSLLELPSILAGKGFSSLEICHFHFSETNEAYLSKLRNSFQAAGLRFYTLLLDYGDISSADETRRHADIEWLKGWIDNASAAGAERVRIIAGDADAADQEGLARSAEALIQLCDYAAEKNVRVVTENFHALTSTADNCLALLEKCGGRLGLTSDFGNFKGNNKYDELNKIIPFSESIHAKADTDEQGLPDKSEFIQCMELVKDSGYEGPVTIVYDGPHDMWDGIERVRKLVKPYLT